MKIIYYDGSTLECNTIEFSTDGKSLIADDYRIIPLIEVVRIVTAGSGLTNMFDTRQTEQRWIPCSEGSPKKDGRYQVTRYDYVTKTGFIDILWYEKGLWWDRRYTGDYAVTAWMPLPEPYQEAKQ